MFPVKTDVSLSTGRQMAKKCKKKGKKSNYRLRRKVICMNLSVNVTEVVKKKIKRDTTAHQALQTVCSAMLMVAICQRSSA